MSTNFKIPSKEEKLTLVGELQGVHKANSDDRALKLAFFNVTDQKGVSVYAGDLGHFGISHNQYIAAMRPKTPTRPMKISLELVSEGTMDGKPLSEYKIARILGPALRV